MPTIFLSPAQEQWKTCALLLGCGLVISPSKEQWQTIGPISTISYAAMTDAFALTIAAQHSAILVGYV